MVLGEGHEPSDELAGEIKTFVRGHLSAYAYPRKIEFVDDLPKTLTGKIRRSSCAKRSSLVRPSRRLPAERLGLCQPGLPTNRVGRSAG